MPSFGSNIAWIASFPPYRGQIRPFQAQFHRSLCQYSSSPLLAFTVLVVRILKDQISAPFSWVRPSFFQVMWLHSFLPLWLQPEHLVFIHGFGLGIQGSYFDREWKSHELLLDFRQQRVQFVADLFRCLDEALVRESPSFDDMVVESLP